MVVTVLYCSPHSAEDWPPLCTLNIAQACLPCTGCTAQKAYGQLCGSYNPLSVVCSVSLWHAALSILWNWCSAMEDVPTTLEMHQKGWVTKAVDVNYAEGFAPDNLPELYAQR